jgi:hypothetical protein
MANLHTCGPQIFGRIEPLFEINDLDIAVHRPVDALLRRYFNRVTSLNDKRKRAKHELSSTRGFLLPTAELS